MNTDTHKLLVGAIRTLVNIMKRTAEPEKPKHAPQPVTPPQESGMQERDERSRRKQEIKTRFGF